MFLCSAGVLFAQPIVFDTTAVTAANDTCEFHVQIPSNYDPQHPPAILVGWHALGGTQYEIFAQSFDELCEERGWIIASHMGPNDRHWNTRIPQLHCRAMLDWLAENYPFALDSIYMCGGSMGAAAGQVWHNNNCAYDDYLIAATAGGSQILDCDLRQVQYLAAGDTNRSMRVAFGGLPFESDSTGYEYHRYSAVYFADTTESMHFNSLTIPVWSNWGSQQAEWDAYGYAAQALAILRSGGAFFHFAPAPFVGHGFPILPQAEVVDWFAQQSANRFPDTLALAADNDGRYYFCDVVLGELPYTFARWNINKDAERKRLDISLIRNVEELTVNFVFPWPHLDTLYCSWSLLDTAASRATIRLTNMPASQLTSVNGTPLEYVTDHGELAMEISGTQEMVITFADVEVPEPQPVPTKLTLTRAYPNPFNSQFNLTISSEQARNTTVDLYDVRGRLAQSVPVTLVIGSQTKSINVSGLATGIYFARVADSRPLKVLLIR